MTLEAALLGANIVILIANLVIGACNLIYHGLDIPDEERTDKNEHKN